MDQLLIEGGRPLEGDVFISGSKNATLPLMAATLLTSEPVVLHNIPYLLDIITMNQLLLQHGSELSVFYKQGDTPGSRSLAIRADKITNLTAPYEIVRQIRASVLVLGPLLARFGEAKVSLPGGCAIGTRPIDMHLQAFEAMGAEVTLEHGYVLAKTSGKLHGADITFPFVSVGATQNVLMAATIAEGVTTINNAAREPEVCFLADSLVKMGAKIHGIGSSKVVIEGQPSLHGAEIIVPADRIEAATFIITAAITNGELALRHVNFEDVENLVSTFEEAGIEVLPKHDHILARRFNGSLNPVQIITAAYPGFPTDIQAQIMALTTIANGESSIIENIFENRFMHVPELCRMGANIHLKNNTAHIIGVNELCGAEVMATDLRASASLVLAGLAAKGSTLINRVYHIDRGYERIEEKLSKCGAKISRLNKVAA